MVFFGYEKDKSCVVYMKKTKNRGFAFEKNSYPSSVQKGFNPIVLALAMMLLNVNTLTEHLQWLLLLVHFANPTQWVQISPQGASLFHNWIRNIQAAAYNGVRTVHEFNCRMH